MKKGMRFEVFLSRKISGDKDEEIRLGEIEATQIQGDICYARIINQTGDIPTEVPIIIEKGNKFQAIRNLGQLEISTDPQGAYISLGKTPLTGFTTPTKVNL